MCAGDGADEAKAHASAELLKAKGNAAFKARNFSTAEDFFSEAILKDHRCHASPAPFCVCWA